MKYYSQYRTHDLFELQQSLSGLSKSNRWVKLADNLPWDKIEKEYNKRLRNAHHGAGNKPARMVVGALIVKHVEDLSDEKTIQVIRENPYMQYLLGLP
ncbi:MAG: transposase, partial [Bacteroidaceae bacterium]|nr:transposase [Bacteroidaceae bacterium]